MSNNGSGGASRTAKATETRLRKRNEKRERLYEHIKQSPEPLSDYRCAFDLDLPLPAVRLAFEEDGRFIELMRRGQIGLPTRSLKLPKWSAVLSDDERGRLPRIESTAKFPKGILAFDETGDSIVDANVEALTAHFVEIARKSTPRSARAHVDDVRIILGSITEKFRASTDRVKVLAADNRQLQRENASLSREVTELKKLQVDFGRRLELLENPLAAPPPRDLPDEARAH